MSLNSETIQTPEQKRARQPQVGIEALFKTSWMRLDSIVTSLLGIDEEGAKYRAAMKADLRLVELSGLPIRRDQPQFAPYLEAEKVLEDLENGCR